MKKLAIFLLSLVVFMWNPTSITHVSAQSSEDFLDETDFDEEELNLAEDDEDAVDDLEGFINDYTQLNLVMLEPDVEEERMDEEFTHEEEAVTEEEEVANASETTSEETASNEQEDQELAQETVEEEPAGAKEPQKGSATPQSKSST